MCESFHFPRGEKNNELWFSSKQTVFHVSEGETAFLPLPEDDSVWGGGEAGGVGLRSCTLFCAVGEMGFPCVVPALRSRA